MYSGTDTDWTGVELLPDKCLDIYEDDNYENAEEDVKNFGEVFTPSSLVNEMLNKLPKEVFTNKEKTFLDNSCGNGQFLFQVLKRKMDNGISYRDAISTIYGVDINQKNVDECKARLLMGYTNPEWIGIIDNNIICADALDENHKGWRQVGYMWSGPPVVNTFFDF